MKAEIYPGILTHTLEEYATHLEMVEATSAEWAHIDIADGQFVQNITVMPHEFSEITTRLKLEAHLMTFMPERYFPDLTVTGFSRVLLHREAYKDLEECAIALKHAKDYFPEVGLVINPNTEVEEYHQLPIDALQCMSVFPGASGQPLVGEVYAILKQVKSQNLSAVIAVDGGISEDNIKELQKAGASRFVITSHLFVRSGVSEQFHNFSQLVTGGI